MSNGAGTDHAWAGNHFVLGGAVLGKKVHGEYIDDFSLDSKYNVGGHAGRLLPTTSWEAVWHAVAQWFDVDASKMEEILPNLPNFPADDMIKRAAMFEN